MWMYGSVRSVWFCLQERAGSIQDMFSLAPPAWVRCGAPFMSLSPVEYSWPPEHPTRSAARGAVWALDRRGGR